ncbi:asparagine synthetase domain-containing protein CG17486 [Pectinophora gossypiella]|uniref:asparagine synthetase domain-containing protein CG17486 n=1 Tax=Pectinophora gossypiella TaxID=13191 RepID=UPI00214F4C91|nr:asparagine synthetase domain-containing protein CG17486 [Pectinophora gossypiella]
MCGILFELLYNGRSILHDEKVLQRIKNRGPDCSHVVELDIGSSVKATFCGAVLWMQGPHVTPQPVQNDRGILLYNGDIFDETWDRSVSDTQEIMLRLSTRKDDLQIVKELKTFKGPFSIIYYNKVDNNLFFTRDRIGRNTLLFHKDADSILISSVLGRQYKCVEIPATHIQVLNLETKQMTLHPWVDGGKVEEFAVEDWLEKLQKQSSLPDEEVVFELKELETLEDTDGIINYIENIVQETKCTVKIMQNLLEQDHIKKTVSNIIELLEKSVKIRLNTQPNKCKHCLHEQNPCTHCTIGVLFSGGLDCTILAFLADKYVHKDQSIELLNVAFKKEENGTYDVPDRLTGRQSFEELKKLCPGRKWVFREINVPKEELEGYQKSIIADLLYPRQTILDESLGSALWFAARGQDGDYTCPCRVLLLGSGADELFGGYLRHRNAYKRHGWQGLNKELHWDWKRISFRNLARDSRVICDHSRQPRMPYLDEDFSNFVLNLKPWLKCFPVESLGPGIGDKLMLRLVAFSIGLSDVVTFPKRALQFGSRIANKKEKSSDLSKLFIDVKLKD